MKPDCFLTNPAFEPYVALNKRDVTSTENSSVIHPPAAGVLLNSSALVKQLMKRSQGYHLSLTGWGLTLTGVTQAQKLLWDLKEYIVLQVQNLGMLDVLYLNIQYRLCKTQEHNSVCAEPFLWMHPSLSFLPVCTPPQQGLLPPFTAVLGWCRHITWDHTYLNKTSGNCHLSGNCTFLKLSCN